MRILYVTRVRPWFGPYGGKLRNDAIIQAMTRQHEVHIALPATSPQDPERLALSAPDAQGTYHLLAPARGGWGDDGWRNYGRYRPALIELMRQVVPDVVWYFEKYAVRAVGGIRRPTPAILDFGDVPWHRLLRRARQERGVRRHKSLLLSMASRVEDECLARRAAVAVIANPEERHTLRLRAPLVIPNAVSFSPSPAIRPRLSRHIVFIGSLTYSPNSDGVTWFCDAVWPRVRAAVPDAELDIVGGYDASLARLGKIAGVHLHGFVDDLTPFQAHSALLIVPLRIGSGTRLKIIEAWATGLPVVATRIGAEGLGAIDGVHLCLADDPESLASQCVALLREPATGARLARTAYEYGAGRFGFSAVQASVERVLSSLRSRQAA